MYTPTKRWNVARMWNPDFSDKRDIPLENEWQPIDKIRPVSTFELIWARDTKGVPFTAYHFSKPPFYYYADKPEVVDEITDFCYIRKD